MRRALGIVGVAVLATAVACNRPPTLSRVRPLAKKVAPAPIRIVCKEAGVGYPPRHILIRAFKAEKELELWGQDGRGKMRLLRTYPIAAASGGPGPKRREGDLQVPEGVYRVDVFNPNSQFHLSLGLNYPNKSDRILGDSRRPGNEIFIHGNQVSIGCLAMTDRKIDEIYALASTARSPIPVHIFPCRMEGSSYGLLKLQNPGLVRFWRQLEPVYRRFEATHKVPGVAIDGKGNYVMVR